MMKYIFFIFLLLSFSVYGQTYYPIVISAPYGGVAQTACLGAPNTATTVSYSVCSTTTPGVPLTATANWYFNGTTLVHTESVTITSTGGTISLPAGVFNYTDTGTFTGGAGGFGLFCQLTWTGSSPCGGTTINGPANTIIVNPLPGSITGTNTACVGATSTLSSVSGSGIWSSSNAAVGTVGSISGVVTGILAGTTVITYTISTGCISTRVFTVNPLPAAISGASSVCVGASNTLSTTTTGGSWSSSNTAVGTIGSGTGEIYGISTGTTVITYTAPTGCTSTRIQTVNPLPLAITGTPFACVGLTTSLADSTAGGTWSSSNTAVGTIGTSGVLTGISGGTTTITYAVATGCFRTYSVTINPLPTIITGTPTVCVGYITSLTNSITGGTWVSSSTSTATIGSSSGIVNGLAVGNTIITYTLPTGCARTMSLTVNPLPTNITGDSSLCVASTTLLSNSTSGGTWSSSNITIATIGSSGGIVTGISSGTSIISYTLTTGCFKTTLITVNPLPGAITGDSITCEGVSINLYTSSTGGTWMSTNPAYGTVNTVGLVTGISTGIDTIKYILPTGCYSYQVISIHTDTLNLSPTYLCEPPVNVPIYDPLTSYLWITYPLPLLYLGVGAYYYSFTYGNGGGCVVDFTVYVYPRPSIITGDTVLCVGSTRTLSNSTLGGVWSISDSSIATVNSSGVVTGISAGTATVTYTLTSPNGCFRTRTIIVNPLPAIITGPSQVCVGSTITLLDSSSGGTWSSSDTTVGTIGITSGMLSGISSGTTIITYRLPTSCYRTTAITVNPLPANIIGLTSVCVGDSITLSNLTSGGTWSSSNSAVGSVGTSTGIVTGVSAGGVNITYTLPTGCFVIASITVNPLPNAGAISGPGSVCTSNTITLASSISGGTWSSSNTAVGTIGSSSGIITGISTGTTIITYTVINVCGTATTTIPITVNPLPANITGPLTVCTGSNVTLANVTSGGIWSSSNTANGTIDSASGILTGISSGTTVITYTIPTGCYSILELAINPSPTLIAGASTLCAGSTLTLSNTTSGGTWSSSNSAVGSISSSSGILSGISSGTTLISYTLSTGCFTSIVITVNPLPAAITGSASFCVGLTTTLSNITTGGSWSSNNIAIATVNSSGLVTGILANTANISYTLTTGCYVIKIVTINPLPTTAPTNTSPVCEGGTINLNSNATGATIYSWMGPGSFTSTSTAPTLTGATSIMAGVYTVTVSAVTGCSATGTTTVTVNTIPTTAATNTSPACVGSTVVLNANATGATSYFWSGPSGFTSTNATPSLTTVTSGMSGTYTVTVSAPSTGCSATSTTIVTINALPTTSPTNTSPACVGGTVNLDAVATGTGTLSYTWSGPASFSSTSATPSRSPATLPMAGIYTVIATAPGTGCSVTATTTVSINPTPTAAPTNTSPVCIGGTVNFNATATATGTISYAWSGPLSFTSTSAIPSRGSITSAMAGVYTVTVTTPGSGCTATATTTVTVNPTPTAAPTNNGPICIGGTVTLTPNPSGGASIYSWSGPNLSSTTAANPTASPTVTSTYSLTVSSGSASGCSPTTIYTTTVTVNSLPTAAPTNTSPVCVGGTVNFNANATGATSYSWAGPSSFSSTSATPSLASVTLGMSGIYTLIATAPGIGCSVTATTTVSINPTPTAAPTNTSPVCVGGTVNLNATATATGTISYAWSGPLSFTSTSGIPSRGSITSAMAGVYTVTVTTPGSGCTATATTTVTVNPTPTAAPTNNGPICIGGTVTLTANPSGGASIYSWSGPNLSSTTTANPTATPTVTSTYSLSVSSGTTSGCSPTTVYTTIVTVNPLPTTSPTNTSPVCVGGTVNFNANATGATSYSWVGPSSFSSTSATPSRSPATLPMSGIYTVIATAPGTGCSVTATTTVSINPTPTAAPTNTSPVCIGGTVNFNATATATGTISYAWSGPLSFTSTSGIPSRGSITSAMAGVYTVTVTTPGSGCTAIATTTVTVNPTPTAAPTNNGPICIGGTVTLTANPSGGASIYSWSGPNLSSTTIANPTATPTVTSTYSLSVSSGTTSGCSPTTVYTTIVTVNSLPTTSPTNTSPVCIGGTVNLNANATATGTISYTWSGPSSFSSTLATPSRSGITSLMAGVYTVTVTTPGAGCTATATTTVTVNLIPTAAPSNNGPICIGGTVTLTANPSGGASFYSWSGPNLSSTTAANPTATPTVTSTYSLTVSSGSASGCSPTTIYTTTVTVNSLPTAAPTNTSPVCVGGTVNFNANATGATSYSWAGPSSFSSTSATPSRGSVTIPMAGTYTVTVSGSGPGCVATATTTVTINPTPTTAPTNTSPVCVGGIVNFNANATAIGTISYTWSGPLSFSSTLATPSRSGITSPMAGVYTVIVTTPGSGCTATATTTVTVNPIPTAAPSNNGPICIGGTVTLTANPSSGASNYSWSGPNLSSTTAANPTATPTVTSTYSLTVSSGSASGCSPTTIYTTTVTVNSLPTAAPTNTSPVCVGGTVNFNANATGATSYSWAGPSSFSSTSATPSRGSVTIPMAGTYTLTVSGSGPGCVATATTTVTINPTPTTAPTNTSPVCVGGTVNFNANATAIGTISYTWSGPLSFSSTLATPSRSGITSPMAGVYTVIVTTPGSGCTATATTAVTVNPIPTAAPSNNGPICIGGTVTLTANPSGGASFYSWSGPNLSSTTAANPTATPTVTSTYSLTVSSGSASGCSPTTIYTTTVTVNSLPTAAPTNTSPVCVGGTVNFNANATGATSYSWAGPSSFSSTSATPSRGSVTILMAGTYTLTVSGSGPGCVATATTTVTINPTPTTAPTNTSPVCVGGTVNFNANATAIGMISYTWSGPLSFSSILATPSRSGITSPMAGVYTVIVTTPGSGCTATATTTVTVNPIPTAAPSNNGPICIGGTVTLTANPSGGASNYSWSGPNLSSTTAANPTATPTVTSTYSLTVSSGSASGCSPTTIYTTTVTVNPLPTTSPTNTSPVCVGGTVNFNANATGATSYSWAGPSSFSSTSATPSRGSITSAMAGTYTVTVSRSGPGCVATATTTVTINPIPTAAPTNTSPVCAGGTVNFNANATATGTISYTWSGPLSFSSTLATPSRSGITSPMAGVYTVIVTTPGSGCTATATTTVTVNPIPTAAPSNNGPICIGGTVTLTANPSGGASFYSWSGPNLSSTTAANPTATPTVTSTYSLTVSGGSASGCSPTTIYTTTVTVNPLPTTSPTNTSPVCVGGTVNFNANATGATSYSWAGPLSFSSTSATPSRGSITSTMAGTYTVTVSRSGPGCVATATTTVTINPIPTAAPTNTSPVCAGGTVNFNANATATGTISYTWSGPLSFSSTLATPSRSGITSPMAGVYTVIVTTPGSGCTATATTTVTVNPIPTAAPSNNGPICIGGTVTLTANPSGGASFYSWSGPNLSSTTAANPTATPTVTSTYSLTVSSGSTSGCSPTTIYTTTVTVNSLPTAAPTNTSPVCVGGTVNFNANATGATSYSWAGPSSFSSTSATPSRGSVTIPMAGTYTVTVSGSGPGCVATATTTVTINPTPTTAPTNTSPVCVGGTVNFNANATAIGMISYTWSGPLSFSSTLATPSRSGITSPMAGVYTVIVTTPGSGCTATATTTVTVNPIPTAAPSNNGPICIGGTVTLTANPSSGASNYSWSGPNLSSTTAANPTATPTVTSTYSLTVSSGSASGCSPTTIYTTTVTVNPLPTTSPTNTSPVCVGGTVNFNANATGATSYSWAGPLSFSSTSTTPSRGSITSTMAGTYTVTVSRSGPGCVATATTTVTINPIPTAAPTNTSPVCAGGTVNFNANATATGTISYTWSGPLSFSSTLATPSRSGITSPMAGVYTVIVTTPGSGCTATATTTVTVNPIPTAAPSNNGPICIGGTVTLTANPSGGASFYSWSGPNLSSTTAANPTATPTVTSTYSLTVSSGSASGCSPTTIYTTTVTVNSLPTAAPTNTSPVCVGGTVNFNANATGATSYSWAGPSSFSSTSATPSRGSVTILMAGTYTLTVSGSGPGCVATATTTVTINPTPTTAPTNTSPVCVGGTVNFNANATAIGTISYTWSGPLSFSSTLATPSRSGITSPMAGVYTVIVTTPGSGCTATATTAVTVNPIPTAAPSNNGPICIGGTVTLTANPSGGASFYSWSGPNLSSTTLANPTATPTVTSTYSLTVSGGSASGCSPTTIYTTTVTVNPLPTTSPTNTSPVCVGGTVNFDANATGATSYSWAGPSSFTSTGATPSRGPVTLAMAGIYTVTVSRIGPGCVTTATTTVTINPIPTAAPTNTSPVCAGGTVNFNANAMATGTISYTWSGPLSFTSTLATPSRSDLTTPMAGAYTVTVTTPGSGCTATATTTVTVNPTPAAAPSNNGPICIGGTVTLTANPSGGASFYSWSGPNLSSTTLANPTATPTVTSSYSLTVSSGTASGCSPTTVYTTTVTVNSLPTTSPTNTSPVCVGGTVNFDANATGATSYSWAGPSSFTSTGATPSRGPVTLAMAGIYTVTVSRIGPGCLATATTTVTINPIPTAAPTNTSPVCAGGTVNFNANATSTGTISYTWSGPLSFNSTLATPSRSDLTSPMAGVYTVIVTTPGSGCTATATTTVTVNPNPANISGALSICYGETSTLSNITPGGFWSSSNPSVASIGSVSGIVNGISTGTSTIIYSLPTGCISTIVLTVNPLPQPLFGVSSACVGQPIILTDSTGNIVYNLTTLPPGITTVTYSTFAGCSTTYLLTINPLPALITGVLSSCSGSSLPLSNSTVGGKWSSSNAIVAAIDSNTGIVTSLAEGTATISYILPTGCYRTTTISFYNSFIIDSISAISPSTCSGTDGSITLYGLSSSIYYAVNYIKDGVTHTKTKSTDITGKLIIDSLAAGTYTNIYASLGGCFSNFWDTTLADPLGPLPIMGVFDVCIGSTTMLYNTTIGGVWSSSLPSIANVSGSGMVLGLSPGTAQIKYSVSNGCESVVIVTVNASPSINVLPVICIGDPKILTGSPASGIWSSGNLMIASIDSLTGLLSGIGVGTVIISYKIGTSCITTTTVNVQPSPSKIIGQDSLCIGTSITLQNTVPGGTWSSSNITVAVIGSTDGIAVGILAGTSGITYKLPTGCFAAKILSVNPLPDAGVIIGLDTVCIGAQFILNNNINNGIWSSSNASIAQIGNSNGLVNAIAAGTVMLSYSIDSDQHGCKNNSTHILIVLSEPNFTISGSVTQVKCHGATDGEIVVDKIGGSNFFNYFWSSGDFGFHIQNIGVGTYSVTITDSLTQCKRKESFDVGEPEPITLSANMEPDFCKGNTGSIACQLAGGTPPYNIEWSNNQNTINIYGLAEGTYFVTIEDQNNCHKKYSIFVTGVDCDSLIVHDLITPNGDGYNDVWFIEGISGYPNNEVEVYDKFGDLLFRKRNYSNDWDGKQSNRSLVPDGVYFYVIKLNAPNRTGSQNIFTGSLLLSR